MHTFMEQFILGNYKQCNRYVRAIGTYIMHIVNCIHINFSLKSYSDKREEMLTTPLPPDR